MNNKFSNNHKSTNTNNTNNNTNNIKTENNNKRYLEFLAENAEKLVNAGCDIIVSGTAITKSNNFAETIKKLKV